MVVSDADLMDAWLSAKLDVRDADVEQMRQKADVRRFSALVDLAEPATLLIIVCGVKAARNEAMPEVLLEVLHHREHLNKPTWLVDQPSYLLREGPGDYKHISYNHNVGDFIAEWKHLILPETGEVQEAPKPPLVRKNIKSKPVPIVPVEDPGSESILDIFEMDMAADPSPMLNGTRSFLNSEDGEASWDDRKKKKGGRR